MQPDPELERWRREWQAQDVIAQDVRQRVSRESRQMRREVAMEIVVTLVMGGGSLVWALMSRRVDVVVLALAVSAFIAIGWATSMILRRGAWQPATATTAAFLELSILRCRRNLQAVAANAVLYVVILAFDLIWLYYYKTQTAPIEVSTFLMSAPLLAVWPGTAILAVIAARHRRKLHRELQNLADLQQQVADDARP